MAALPGVKAWMVNAGYMTEDDTSLDHDLPAALVVALTEGSCGYTATRRLEDVTRFPADDALVTLMIDAFTRMDRMVPEFVRAWVMKTGTRFKAVEEDVVRFRVGALTLSGTVRAVVKAEARGCVEITKGLNNKPQVLSVMAEDIIDNLGPSRRRPKTPGPKGVV